MKINYPYNQENGIDFVENKLGFTQWVQVCGFLPDNKNYFIFAFLVKNDKKDEFLNHVGSSVSFEQYAGFNELAKNDVVYSFNDDDIFEYLVRERTFGEIEPDFYELSDEFLLVFNAFKKDKQYVSASDDGNVEIIAKIDENRNIFINIEYLKRFLAAKQIYLGFIFDFRYSSNEKFTSDLKEDFTVRKDLIAYEFYSGDTGSGDKRYFTRLNGRKIIEFGPQNESFIWPFEKAKTYPKFKIKYTNNGQILESTCNPDLLDNNFNLNPGALHYLTPVAFKKEVLKKYIDHPDNFRVSNDHLSCGQLWGVEIDASHDDVVFIYLGDLGRDLPESEYQHWLEYNIITDEKLSETTMKRDFFAVFSDDKSPDGVFIDNYRKLNEIWNKNYGFNLFIELKNNDKYCYQKVIMPVLNEQHEFDELCLFLAKITVDSINVKEIKKIDSINTDDKSIVLLQNFLMKRFNDIDTINEIIQGLRNVQSLRSESAGHVKGSNLYKLYSKLNLDLLISKKDFISSSKLVFEFMNRSLGSLISLLEK